MQLTTDSCCIGFMRSIFHFRRSVIRNKKGRSVLMRKGRSLSVESSHCLVFGIRGDRTTHLNRESAKAYN
ncbi:hypothetical protein [Microcoleus sp. D2_18a_D3]|uniref:hypothetical protein n=1 Tax=Microcoleus sp. D2_18a_D3 TaxID=3055330 RepID=UPI002FD102CA